jgi:hypothetical protein
MNPPGVVGLPTGEVRPALIASRSDLFDSQVFEPFKHLTQLWSCYGLRPLALM